MTSVNCDDDTSDHDHVWRTEKTNTVILGARSQCIPEAISKDPYEHCGSVDHGIKVNHQSTSTESGFDVDKRQRVSKQEASDRGICRASVKNIHEIDVLLDELRCRHKDSQLDKEGLEQDNYILQQETRELMSTVKRMRKRYAVVKEKLEHYRRRAKRLNAQLQASDNALEDSRKEYQQSCKKISSIATLTKELEKTLSSYAETPSDIHGFVTNIVSLTDSS